MHQQNQFASKKSSYSFRTRQLANTPARHIRRSNSVHSFNETFWNFVVHALANLTRRDVEGWEVTIAPFRPMLHVPLRSIALWEMTERRDTQSIHQHQIHPVP